MQTIPEHIPDIKVLRGHKITPELLNLLSRYVVFPKSARDLIRLIGLDAASLLVTAWGGQVFRVPAVQGGAKEAGEKAYQKLVEIIGEEAAHAIVKEYRGTLLSVPNLTIALHAYVQDTVRNEFDVMVTLGGLSSTEAVFELGIKHRMAGKTIEKIVNTPFNQTIDTDQKTTNAQHEAHGIDVVSVL